MTKDLQETIKYTLANTTPEDNRTNDNATHKQIRALIQEKIDTNDKEFTLPEIKTAVASMKEKKEHGKDGIPSEVYKSLVETLPRYITAIYKGCLKESTFPKRWKTALILPIIKPGKEGRNVGGCSTSRPGRFNRRNELLPIV